MKALQLLHPLLCIMVNHQIFTFGAYKKFPFPYNYNRYQTVPHITRIFHFAK